MIRRFLKTLLFADSITYKQTRSKKNETPVRFVAIADALLFCLSPLLLLFTCNLLLLWESLFPRGVLSETLFLLYILLNMVIFPWSGVKRHI